MDQSPSSLPPLLPRAVLFGNPERVSPRLSPDGTRLAYLAPLDGVMNVYVRTVGQTDDRPVTHDTARPIRMFTWADDGKHLLYLQDKGGDENFHVFAADFTTPGNPTVRDLTPFDGARAMIAATEPTHPNEILISSNQRDPRFLDVYRCDLTTGDLTLVAENPGNVVGWVADRDLAVRACLATDPAGGSEMRVRDTADGPWRTLRSVPFEEQVSPLIFTNEGTGLYFLSNKDVDTLRLYHIDLAADAAPTLIHSRDDVDLAGVLLHPTTRELQAVSYDRARAEWVTFDPQVAADFATLATLSEGDFAIVGRDHTDTTWIVVFYRDNGPSHFFVYDRATGKGTLLFTDRPALENQPLATMTPVEIPARDGLSLPSYLTLPPGKAPDERVPLILVVHGGPWARDHWSFSPDIQWLANRGYAVLQVNYRGSTGFGKAHLNAGNREWAAKMHDDLIDAVDWAIAQGHADPDRVAIYGGSYGGYATLVGLTFTPEKFACGVDIVGPSNLITLMESIPPYWEPLRAQFARRVGEPGNEAFLRSRSPLFLADRIVRPLLVAQGANDPRVKQAEADQIVAAAHRNGKDVLYLLFPDEGHGFARPENRIKFNAAAEAFLAKHLGGRCEPAHPGEEPPLVDPSSVS